jgi:hypothetical protein
MLHLAYSYSYSNILALLLQDPENGRTVRLQLFGSDRIHAGDMEHHLTLPIDQRVPGGTCRIQKR